MILVRRMLITAATLALTLTLAAPDAAAARHHKRHAAAHRTHRTTQAVTAIYQVVARPHAPRRLHATHTSAGDYAQGFERGLMLGS